eukprot:CAMPEP_0196662928 /NCGR_PEP_ID=MMETSP1086-20130531/50870_1 /TAXON_ID=77921 /ORGANISM="Cyanoptyche  gloeocystis , Strain SAG4.97" /LENGTH=229 /DNA_ID=CAMNT_0041998561 /DNA_START=41 /DNA_END=730 /DNA_ORIENTATION=+
MKQRGDRLSYARSLSPAVGELCKAPSVTRVRWGVLWPRPASETCSLVVLVRLDDFGAGVHYERPLLRHWLIYGPPLEKQKIYWPGVIHRGMERSRHGWVENQPGEVLLLVGTNRKTAVAAEKIQHPVDARVTCRWQVKIGPGFHPYLPHSDIVLRTRGPRVGWGRRWGLPIERARGDYYLGDLARIVDMTDVGRFLGPEHLEVGRCCLVLCRQIEPDLEQLQRVRALGI